MRLSVRTLLDVFKTNCLADEMDGYRRPDDAAAEDDFGSEKDDTE